MGKGVMQWPIPAGPDVLDRDLTSSSAKTVGRMYYFSICRRKHQRTILPMSSAHVFSQSNWLWLKSAIISLNCKSVIADQDNKIPLAGAGLRAVIEGQAPASLTVRFI